ncbi:HIT-like domain-containing protein [Jimgerdemannia flammicorona]|uniref:HIT-like domain-containing protein n=1 Tax=Jimgerdemannia flammicorona TaxID=994334 RepID=A0A433QZ27_9FUNG|nr:HIT-like domain-containing protein [Jimgerdemannia flammicorona]
MSLGKRPPYHDDNMDEHSQPSPKKAEIIISDETVDSNPPRGCDNSSHSEPSSACALAFPPLATPHGHISIDISAKIACDVISEFLAAHPKDPRLRLYVVDQDERAVEAFLENWPPDRDARFSVVLGKITEMRSRSRMTCSILVNEATWRLKPGATPVSVQIQTDGGKAMWDETRRLYPNPGAVGNAYPVPLPVTSPLRQRERVRHIIHVIPPNMNPARPDPVPLQKARLLLRKAYTAMLEAYWRIVGEEADRGKGEGDRDGQEVKDVDGKDENRKMVQGDATKENEQRKNGEPKSLFDILMSSSAACAAESTSPPPVHRSEDRHAWIDMLMPYCEHPEQFTSDQMVWYDEAMVVVRDKFPKAQAHFLVMPRRPIDGLTSLTQKDVPTLEALINCGGSTVDKMKAENPHLEFRMGFHAIPSMRQLHMHVISQDFVGIGLKRKEHYNSFTTRFFNDASEVLARLRAGKSLQYDKREYDHFLKGPLRCHLCNEAPATMPALKAHLDKHARKMRVIIC